MGFEHALGIQVRLRRTSLTESDKFYPPSAGLSVYGRPCFSLEDQRSFSILTDKAFNDKILI
jgi:hypothetical protein